MSLGSHCPPCSSHTVQRYAVGPALPPLLQGTKMSDASDTLDMLTVFLVLWYFRIPGLTCGTTNITANKGYKRIGNETI